MDRVETDAGAGAGVKGGGLSPELVAGWSRIQSLMQELKGEGGEGLPSHASATVTHEDNGVDGSGATGQIAQEVDGVVEVTESEANENHL